MKDLKDFDFTAWWNALEEYVDFMNEKERNQCFSDEMMKRISAREQKIKEFDESCNYPTVERMEYLRKEQRKAVISGEYLPFIHEAIVLKLRNFEKAQYSMRCSGEHIPFLGVSHVDIADNGSITPYISPGAPFEYIKIKEKNIWGYRGRIVDITEWFGRIIYEHEPRHIGQKMQEKLKDHAWTDEIGLSQEQIVMIKLRYA